MSPERKPNRLANETSPYLLQHAHNPVEWYPWGGEAFARAREENKPVFLSIGYSACHWCHVMERESFENEAIAAILNREFVSIKVDREERPEVDSIYMQAVQMMTGHGGWPMSMFLTSDAVPFFGGTYFPPEDRYGVPGFPRVLAQIAEAWRQQQGKLEESAEEVRNAIRSGIALPRSDGAISRDSLEQVGRKITSNFDPVHGGFGGAPKFPPSMALEFLLQLVRSAPDERLREVIDTTLTRMARGGIYDHVGGGFHRYSVDARWLVPHFEKMLYDNALLARIYLHAWQWSKNPLYESVVRETLDFVAREMTDPAGGFYSTLDADSEGEEGKFYVWTRSEIVDALGAEDARAFGALYDVSESGNWEGHTILNVPRDPETVASELGIDVAALADVAARAKDRLYAVREKRVRPGRDEKVLTGWNGWMLAAFAEASIAFGSDAYRTNAANNAEFLLREMIRERSVLRSWKDGRAKIAGVLEDHAGAAWGLIAAFEATGEMRYLETARHLGESILERFADPAGAFFDTPDDHEPLIARPKDLFDNATPGGNSVAIEVLHKLAIYFEDPALRRAASSAFSSLWPLAQRYASGFGFLLSTAGWELGTGLEIVVTGSGAGRAALERAVGEAYVPHRVLIGTPSALPLAVGRDPEKIAAYVCRGSVCDEPTSDPRRLLELLRA